MIVRTDFNYFKASGFHLQLLDPYDSKFQQLLSVLNKLTHWKMGRFGESSIEG